ncbi:MAG TPA: LLM class flavin-dependent oxidoreductase [Candidatus Dormibacteraeota bacterium]|nr:LLM class flavin-dependent oxidoreductase [Candidatus Dormibacteraeota bacterium]
MSLVLANPVRRPPPVARMAWDLNALSGGRVVLGLGAGGEVADLPGLGPMRRFAAEALAEARSAGA